MPSETMVEMDRAIARAFDRNAKRVVTEKRLTWTDAADLYLAAADEARGVGHDMLAVALAIHAADCLKIARLLSTGENVMPIDRAALAEEASDGR